MDEALDVPVRVGAVDWGRAGGFEIVNALLAEEVEEEAAADAEDVTAPPLVVMNPPPLSPPPPGPGPLLLIEPIAPLIVSVIPIGGNWPPIGIRFAVAELSARPAVGVVLPLEQGLLVPLAGFDREE